MCVSVSGFLKHLSASVDYGTQCNQVFKITSGLGFWCRRNQDTTGAVSITGGAGANPAVIGRTAGYTLDWSPVSHRADI